MKRLSNFDLDLLDWRPFIGHGEPAIDESARHTFHGKRVLVTGAGGSIGSALSKELARSDPSELVLLDQSELGLYELGRSLQSGESRSAGRLVIGSVCDRNLIQDLFRSHRPHIVFHAAACKHVPLLETNAFAAAQTNVLGTQVIAETAIANRTEQCVLLSTDKAVEPRSIMGATKRVAECIFLTRDGLTKMKVLRLGNVLGSSGSVVPLFLDQISNGEPVTVAHPEATRYFLTFSDAVAYLVASASQQVASGLLIPKLSGPNRISDLASFLMERTSLGSQQSAIAISGLRPGDKMTELMTGADELTESTLIESTLQKVRTNSPTCVEINRCLDQIKDAVGRRDLTSLIRAIHLVVPEYRPSELLQAQIDAVMEASTA